MSLPGYSTGIHPILSLHSMRRGSPGVVLTMDTIWRELEGKDADKYGEFCRFAREYPRCYRYPLECADFRLRTIHNLCKSAHKGLSTMQEPKFESFEVSIGNVRVQR